MTRMPSSCDICLGREGKIQPSNRLPPLLKKHLGVIACGPVRWCESCSKLLEMWDNFSLTARRNLALSHHSIIAVNGITGRRDNHLKNKDIVEIVDLDEDGDGENENEKGKKSDIVLLDDSESSDLDNTDEPQLEDLCDSSEQDEPEEQHTFKQGTATQENSRPLPCTSPQQPDSQVNEVPIIQDVYSISSQEASMESVTEQPKEQEDRCSEDEPPMEQDNVSTTDGQPMEQEDTPVSSPEQPIERKQPMKQEDVPTIFLKQSIEQESDCEPDGTGYAISENEEELLRSPQENVFEPPEPTSSIREELPSWTTAIFEPQCVDVPSDPLSLDPLGIKTEPIDDDLLDHPMILNHCTKCKRKFTNMDALALHFKYRHGLLLDKEMQCTRISIKKQAKYKCMECFRGFHYKRVLKSHQQSHKKSFTCSVCNVCFSSETLLLKHTESVHNTKRKYYDRTCPYCSKKYETHTALDTHIWEIHSGEASEVPSKKKKVKVATSVTCTYCGATFPSRTQYQKHNWIAHREMHNGVKSVTKSKGKKKSTSKSVKNKEKTSPKHKRGGRTRKNSNVAKSPDKSSVENGTKEPQLFNCNLCSDSYISSDLLDSHVQEYHPKSKNENKKSPCNELESFNVKCKFCGMTCDSAANLVNHILNRHSSDKNLHKHAVESVKYHIQYDTVTPGKPNPQTSEKISSHTSAKISPHTSAKISPQTSAKISPHTSSKISPQTSAKISPHTSSKISPHTSSGISPHTSAKISPQTSAKISPHTSSKISPQTSAKISPHTSAKISPHTSSRISPHTSAKISPQASTKISPHTSAKISPHTSTKISPHISAKISPHTSAKISPQSTAAVYNPEQVPDALKNRFTFRNSMLYCNFCLKSYSSILPMAKHIKNTHLPDLEISFNILAMKPKKCFECKICKLEFDSESSLAFHETGHKLSLSQSKVCEQSPSTVSSRSGNCTQCVHCKEYFMSEELANHMKIHKNSSCLKASVETSKPKQPSSSPPVMICEFFCDFCGKKLLSKVALEYHLRRSHLERY